MRIFPHFASAQFHSFLMPQREMHGIRGKEREYFSQCFSSSLYKQFLSLFFGGGGGGDWNERKEKFDEKKYFCLLENQKLELLWSQATNN